MNPYCFGKNIHWKPSVCEDIHTSSNILAFFGGVGGSSKFFKSWPRLDPWPWPFCGRKRDIRGIKKNTSRWSGRFTYKYIYHKHEPHVVRCDVPSKKQMMVIIVRCGLIKKQMSHWIKSKRQDVLSKLCTFLSQESRVCSKTHMFLAIIANTTLHGTNISHLEKGKSSTQKCWVVGDTWSFPGEYSFISW